MKITLTTEYYSDPSHRIYKSKEALEKRATGKIGKSSPTNLVSSDDPISDVQLTISGEAEHKSNKAFKKYLKLKKKSRKN